MRTVQGGRPDLRGEPGIMRHLGIVATIAVLAFAVFLVGSRGRAIDPAEHERYSTDLARLQTLDHRLNEDLMRARTGRMASYDPLVRTDADLHAVHDRLARVPRFLSDSGARELAASVARSREILEEQSVLLERFKSENAILLNSLRFLPVAADDLAAHVEDSAVVARIGALVRDVLMLNLWHEPARAARAQAELDGLGDLPALAEGELDLVRTHAGLVLRQRPSIEQLLADLYALQAERGSEDLDVLYRTHHATAVHVRNRDDVVLFSLALAVVVLGAAFIILRMRRANRAIEQTSEQLAAAVDMKNRFVSMTSHEFRTPLAVILSSTELLEAYGDRWKPEKKRDHFERVRGSIHHMTQLIDGILLIGRRDAGVLDFKPGPTDLERVCREVISAVRSKTGHAREIELAPPEVSEVVADERLIRHILDNLVSNAIKYSPEGGDVSLVVQCDGESIVLRVKDQGLGIPEEDRGHLFESFRRGTNVGAIPGTGLGLAVVRRATELHGGTITVESKVGAGSTFEVRLPVSRPAVAKGSEPRNQGEMTA